MTIQPSQVTDLRRAFGSILVVTAILTGCSAGSGTAVTPPQIASPTAAVAAAATPIPALLLLGATADSPLGVAVASWVQARGWAVMVSAGPGEQPGLRGVVAVGPEPQSIESIASLSDVVILVDPNDTEPAANVSTIGGTIRRDQVGFLSGVLAGLASETGWVGRVDGTGGSWEAVYQASFTHGLRYACPRCRLVTATSQEATLDLFRGNGVDVVWAVPGPQADAVLAGLAEGGLWIVWAEAVPAGVRQERMAGGVGFAPEAVIVEALEARLAGEAGRDWPYEAASGSLGLVGLSGEAVSPGRQRLLVEALDALATGELDTGIDPQTGEER